MVIHLRKLGSCVHFSGKYGHFATLQAHSYILSLTPNGVILHNESEIPDKPKVTATRPCRERGDIKRGQKLR